MKNRLSFLKISSVLLTLLISIPMITIFVYLFWGDTPNWEHIKNTVLFEYTYNTLYVMIGVGVLTTILGFTTAYLVSLYNFTFSNFYIYGLILPFAIPTYIMSFIYNGMFGITGSITEFFLKLFDKELNEVPFYDIQSIQGVIIVVSLVLYPYVYLVCRTYLSFESSSILDAAKTLGLNAWQTFYKLVLPISRPAIIAGVTLAVMEATSDFGAMDYFGVSTFVTGIFRTWEGMGSVEDASKLASILMTFLFLIIILERFQRRNINYKSSGKDFKPISKIQLTGFNNFLASFICFIPFFFGFLLPITQLSFWFIDSYEKIIDEDFINLLYKTLELSTISAFLITFIALIITYNYRVSKDKTSGFIVQITKLGYSIPGAVVAVGILSFFGILNHYVLKLFSNNLYITGTVIAVIFGYSVRFIAISINNFEAGFNRIPSSYDDVTEISDIGKFRSFRKVFLPLLKNSALASFIIVFIEIIKELPLTMILRPFNYDTLSIRAFELNEQAQVVESSVPAMFIVLIGMVSVILLTKNTKKVKNND